VAKKKGPAVEADVISLDLETVDTSQRAAQPEGVAFEILLAAIKDDPDTLKKILTLGPLSISYYKDCQIMSETHTGPEVGAGGFLNSAPITGFTFVNGSNNDIKVNTSDVTAERAKNVAADLKVLTEQIRQQQNSLGLSEEAKVDLAIALDSAKPHIERATPKPSDLVNVVASFITILSILPADNPIIQGLKMIGSALGMT
jgi:hypothetical protein